MHLQFSLAYAMLNEAACSLSPVAIISCTGPELPVKEFSSQVGEFIQTSGLRSDNTVLIRAEDLPPVQQALLAQMVAEAKSPDWVALYQPATSVNPAGYVVVFALQSLNLGDFLGEATFDEGG